MKTIFFNRRRPGFTLIELLVVISIIAILAGLILAVAPGMAASRKKSVAYTEMREIETAIEAYKAHYGFYPPDNPSVNSNLPSPLYFELVGSTNNGVSYESLDGRTNVAMASVLTKYGVSAFVNSATSIKGTDDRPGPVSFLKELKRPQTPLVNYGGLVGPTIVLACSEELGLSGAQPVAQWRYSVTHAVNNPGSYDLYVDLYFKGNTNRISNWRKTPFAPY